MRKYRLLLFVLCLCIMAGVFSMHASAAGLENFVQAKTYDGRFADVSGTAWYYENVKGVYELGLMEGCDETRFNPEGFVSVAETITIATRLHAIYQNGEENFEKSEPWYQTYVDYAKENKIITSDFSYYKKSATRGEYAAILAAALPEEALKPINEVVDNAIPDVKIDDVNGEAVYTLYRAGILTGSESGAFNPFTTIKRSEVAAIVSRMALPNTRKSVKMETVAVPQSRSNWRFVLNGSNKERPYTLTYMTTLSESHGYADPLVGHSRPGDMMGPIVEYSIDEDKAFPDFLLGYAIEVSTKISGNYSTMKADGVSVEVYRDGELVHEFIPADDIDSTWVVFEYDAKEDAIIPIEKDALEYLNAKMGW